MKNSQQQPKQEVFDLYDDYAHNRIERREFMASLSKHAVGGWTVAALAAYLMPQYAVAVEVPHDDPRIKTEYIEYDSPQGGGTIKGLLAKPANANGPLPGVVVVHENRGLNPYIEDVAKRLAVAGFIALAPDALSPLGGYPGNDDDGRAMQAKRDRNAMLEDFIAAFYTLKAASDVNGKVGVVGFCFGGWISNMMAVRLPDLNAAVPYYGTQPTTEEAAAIKAPLQLHFGELDKRVNDGWPAYEAALIANDINYQAYMYQNANHGFHNNTTPRYDEAAANLAWERTLQFFRDNL